VQSTRWHFAFALCCHSNATRAPIANPPNSAQLGGTLSFPKLHPAQCSSMGMRPWTDTQTRVTTTHFASSTTQAKCNNYWDDLSLAHMLQLLFSVLCFVLIFTSLDTAPKSFPGISRKKSKSWHDRRCCCLGHVTVLL